VKLKKGDLVMVYDPMRPDGSSTGTGQRGLCIVDEVGETDAKVRPHNQPYPELRVSLSAIHTVYAATFVAEELLK
jgi:hypothetical protein